MHEYSNLSYLWSAPHPQVAYFRERYQQMPEDQEVVSVLKAISSPVCLVAVFGFWCQDSYEMMPMYWKCWQKASNPLLHAKWIAVEREETDRPVRVGAFSIERYPTILLLQGSCHASELVKESLIQLGVEEEAARFFSRLPRLNDQ